MGVSVAVTGAAGNLGRLVLERLLSEPGVDRVVALDLQPLEHPDTRVVSVGIDVRDPGIAENLQGCQTLIHLAFVVERNTRDWDLVWDVNVGGTRNVIGAAIDAGVEQVVYASSIAVYGFGSQNFGGPLEETAEMRGDPRFYYTATKVAVERWLDQVEMSHPKLRVSRLRPTMFLGPRVDAQRRRLALGPLFLRVAAPPLAHHVTHEDDVADAFLLAYRQRAHGAFNVGTRNPLPTRHWGRLLGRPVVVLPAGALGLARWAYQRGVGDVDPEWLYLVTRSPLMVSSEKIRRELGWRPRFETTAEVLRELGRHPTAGASSAVRLLFGSAALTTALRGSLPLSAQERHELRSLRGAVNIELTGEHRSDWHITLRDGHMGLHRGLASLPQASLTLREKVLLDLLAGRTRLGVAQMTGQLRLRGEGGLLFVLGALVEQFRGACKAPGLSGLPQRAFTGEVLRRAGVAAGVQG